MPYFTSVTEAAKALTSSADGRQCVDDSFWICDLGQTVSLLRKWSLDMPQIRPFYAMKSAPHPTIIKVLLLEGAGIDCASKEEMNLALKLGAKPEDIIYSNTNKQISHLQFARRNNVKLTVYDCEEELRKIHAHHPQAKLLLRLKTLIEEETHPMNERFGTTSANAKRLLELSNELGAQTIGISFHVGTACRDPKFYEYALDQAIQLMEYASTHIGINFEMLNIGGGFEGTDYAAEHWKENTATICDRIDAILSDSRFSKLKVIAEPGRYFAETSFSLVANVIAKKVESDAIDYTLNEGVCTSFFSTIVKGECGARRDIIPLKEFIQNGLVRRSRLYGPTSGSFDLIKDFNFADLKIGDWLMWKECGAYTFALSSGFNGFHTGVKYDIVTQKNRKHLSEKTTQYLESKNHKTE